MQKRLCIYFFYDKEGIVDDYVFYFFKEVRPFFNKLCIVVNGKLSKNSLTKLKSVVDIVLLRENKGLDAYAYKFAIEEIGYSKLIEFDEVLFTNFTFYGPFWPIDTMFKKMENKICDWWSLYKCSMKKPYIEWSHLPSFFIVYRKKIIASKDFKEYWDTLPKIETYNDSVMFHEQRQTPFFDKRGFKSSVYFDFSEYDTRSNNEYWPLSKADSLIIKEKFPFLKRRNLYIENDYMDINLASNVIDFVKENTNYPISLIYQNIKRTQKTATIKGNIKYLKWLIKSKLSLRLRKRFEYKARLGELITERNLYNLFYSQKNEFGGYFEIDLKNKLRNKSAMHKNAKALNSGRSGLRYIVKAYNIKKMYVPYYTCPSVIRTLNEEGVLCVFYDIDKSFLPVNLMSEDEFVLYTNYFGVCSNNIDILLKKHNKLIIDNTHAFYYGDKGIASFNSPRKFFDVADGGYVYCKKEISSKFDTDISSYRYLAHLKRLELGANSGYMDFKKNECDIDNSPIKYMSKLTKNLLEHEDFDNIKHIRQANFTYLHKRLKKYNELNLNISSSDVPYKYPFVYNLENLREKCINKKIYITKCWDMECFEIPKESTAYKFQNYLFPIPLDQRYSTQDMEKISSFIIKIIEGKI